jgi:hypothetical protein
LESSPELLKDFKIKFLCTSSILFVSKKEVSLTEPRGRRVFLYLVPTILSVSHLPRAGFVAESFHPVGVVCFFPFLHVRVAAVTAAEPEYILFIV